MGVAALTPPLKWHGGKSYLATRIVALMPPRCAKPNAPEADDPGWLHYVEPYAGGLAVMLANDPEGISEVANDLNGELTNFWDILKGDLFPLFRQRVAATPFSQVEWERAGLDSGSDVVERAARFFIRCRQSLAGRMDAFAPLSRARTRRGMNEQASAWAGAVDGLGAVHERLRRVAVYNRDAIEVIAQQDGPRTLFYLDPPYLHETRATTGEYAHEMTADDHLALLAALADIRGRFLLSGYRSRMYDEFAEARGWHRADFDLPNNSAGGSEKRRMIECVWTNYQPPRKSDRG